MPKPLKQPKKKSISVAFSGSGFLAPIHAGAACSFLDHGYTFTSVAGTSGGSIIAAAVASGMTAPALKRVALTADFRDVLRPSFLSILKGKAYCNGNSFFHFLENLFDFKAFADLPIPCSILATDLAQAKPFIFSQSTTPTTQVGLACRASSAVPVIYEPVIYDGKVLVDGGVVNNIPISALTGSSPKVGITVNDSGKNSLNGPIEFISAIISALLSSNEGTQILLAQHEGAGLVTVNPGNVWFLNTDLTLQQRQDLFKEGYSGVTNWLATQS